MGKLTNQKTGKVLTFQANPSVYEFQQAFRYMVDHPLTGKAPFVEYEGGGPASLRFSLVFDEDLGDGATVADAREFLKEATTVDAETRSIPPLEFRMGTFQFQGFLQNIRVNATRFNGQGEAVAAQFAIELISDGSVEAA